MQSAATPATPATEWITQHNMQSAATPATPATEWINQNLFEIPNKIYAI
jgi:hypothetical protein